MISKEVVLVKNDGGKLLLEQKTNGSLWHEGEEIFATEAEARDRGWKVDAVKVRWGSGGENRKTQ
jgi:hypothetical protein